MLRFCAAGSKNMTRCLRGTSPPPHFRTVACSHVTKSGFKDVLFNAIDGNALYEIEQAAQQLRDDTAQRAYYRRHNPVAAE